MKRITSILVLILFIAIMAIQPALAISLKNTSPGPAQKSELQGGAVYVKNLIRVSFVNTSPHPMEVRIFNHRNDFQFVHWLDESGHCIGTNEHIRMTVPANRTIVLEMELKKFRNTYAFNYYHGCFVHSEDGSWGQIWERGNGRVVLDRNKTYSAGSELGAGVSERMADRALWMSPCYYVGHTTTSTSDTIAKMFTEWMGVKPDQKAYKFAVKKLSDMIVKLSKMPGNQENYTMCTLCFSDDKYMQSEKLVTATSKNTTNRPNSKLKLK